MKKKTNSSTKINSPKKPTKIGSNSNTKINSPKKPTKNGSNSNNRNGSPVSDHRRNVSSGKSDRKHGNVKKDSLDSPKKGSTITNSDIDIHKIEIKETKNDGRESDEVSIGSQS